jgi:hypothetical protein
MWKAKEKTDENDVLAEITTNHTYRFIYINIYPFEWKKKTNLLTLQLKTFNERMSKYR